MKLINLEKHCELTGFYVNIDGRNKFGYLKGSILYPSHHILIKTSYYVTAYAFYHLKDRYMKKEVG
jgi:hypothetical protein